MEIIKRNGAFQEFDIKKTENSVYCASVDINQTLNRSDLNLINHEVLKKLNLLKRGEIPTSSFEIKYIVYEILLENNFDKIANEYLHF